MVHCARTERGGQQQWCQEDHRNREHHETNDELSRAAPIASARTGSAEYEERRHEADDAGNGGTVQLPWRLRTTREGRYGGDSSHGASGSS